VLLIDLDTYASSIGTFLGINQLPPGLAAAARLVGQGRLDSDQFSRLAIAHEVGKGTLSVLTGLASESRWPEITAEKTRDLIAAAVQSYDFVVLDVASPLVSGLKHVGGVVDRNVASRTALENCTTAVVIFNADQVGVKRLCDAYEQLGGLVRSPILVANRLRTTALGASARVQVEDAILEMCRSEVKWFVPDDRTSCDRAVLEMVPLAMLKRSSGARQAIAQFARKNFDIADGRKSASAI
jgi:MinD-like ATPase involved in chromosome partitioning or flagellar assembly